jgi:dTDP-4-dehydrorhamnose 3,5-epimerase
MYRNDIIKNSKSLPDIKKIVHSKFKDRRGLIYSMFDKNLKKKILPKKLFFDHLKINYRKKNVLVGIHYDNKSWKLVTCLRGRIFQAVTNINGNKKNKCKSQIYILSDKKKESVLIPPGYGHSYYCFKNSIIAYALAYKGKYSDVNEQKTINWKNKKIKIKWPCIKPILSTRDKIEV